MNTTFCLQNNLGRPRCKR